MYLEYFGFKFEPFNITPDSRFLFLSERHREALGSLLYGIEQRKGFIALTGEIGCGKTTICRALLGKLDRERVHLALVLNPQLSDLELLQTINEEFGIDADSDSKRVLLNNLNLFLLDKYREDHIVVLVIDEAQRLSPDALEQVRLLSNLETESAKLIQIALVGQPELADLLDLPELEQLNQRITVRTHISPLSIDEITEYIAHRIKIAEPKFDVGFTRKAIRKVYDFSGGVPRRVNVVCDRALLVTYVHEQREVTEDNVTKAIGDLGGMPKRHKKGAVAAAAAPRNAEPEDVAEPVAVAGEKKTAGWPLGLALLFGLGAIAYAITSLDRPSIGTAIPPERGDGNGASINIDTGETGLIAAVPPTATPTLAPSPTPGVAAAEPTDAAAPSPTASVAPPSKSPTIPTPTAPPATPRPTRRRATPTPEPTPEPTEAPKEIASVATATPAPQQSAPPPTPTAAPTESNLISAMMAVTATPSPTPAKPWTYDEDKIVRVADPGVSYPAAVLTWLTMQRNEPLPEDQLALLRSMTREQLAALEITDGVPPLYLREARLPANLDEVSSVQLPLLVQVDNDAPNFGPWAVLVSIDQEVSVLHDPRGGRLQMPTETLNDHLTSIIMPFYDPDQLVGLQPLDRNERVRALQNRLREVGLYQIEPTGVFDPFTKSVVDRFREVQLLPPSNDIDPLFVLRLYVELEKKK